MRRFLRWRRLLVLGVLMGMLLGGGWLYTQSAHAARALSRKLEDRLGVTARVSSLDVGVASTSVSSLEIHERGAAPEARPWVRVAHTEIDVSPLGALFGASPKTVVLNEAEVFLRFDRKGDLLTKFPQSNSSLSSGPLPDLQIESGTLIIQQEGHADSIIRGIKLRTSTENNRLVLKGQVDDPQWGQWSAEGFVDVANNLAQFRLNTQATKHVTQQLLESTPFVNPNAWKAVKLEGDTQAELMIQCDLQTEAVTYRMTMDPKRTRVHVPLIGLTVENCDGQLIAEGATVTLKNVNGQLADGTVLVQSKMDFGGVDDVLQFSAEFKDANVKKLPKLWRVPEAIDGKFGGKVDFVVAILAKGGVRTNGEGNATISDAKFNGVPTAPIKLTMRPARFIGFEFAPDAKPDNPPKAEPVEPKKMPEKQPANPKKDGQAAGLFTGLMHIAANIIKPKDAPKEDRDHINVSLTFRDILVAELLKTARVDLPLNLAGRVTVQVQLGIPTNDPGTLANYRLAGELSSAKLSIEGIEVADAKAKLYLRDGVLQVRDFVGRLPLLGNAQEGGTFKSTFDLQLNKNYNFQGNIAFDNLDLKRSEQLKELLPIPVDLNGVATIKSDLSGTFSPLDVKTSGTVEAKKVLIGGIPINDVKFRWDSTLDLLEINDLTASLLTGEVTGALTIPFKENKAGDGHIKLKDVDLSELSKVFPMGTDVKLDGKANGVLQVRVPAAGEGVGREAKAELELTAPKLKLQNITAEKIKGTGSYAAGVMTYKLIGEALGGSFELEGQFPPNAPNPPKKNAKPKVDEKQPGFLEGFRSLRFKNVKLSQLLARLGQTSTLGKLEAELTGDIPFTIGAGLQLVGVGKIRADRLRWGDKLIASTGQGTLRLTSKELRLEEAVLPVGEGFAKGWITLNRMDIDRSTAGLTLANVPASKLIFLYPDFAGQIDLAVDGRLTSNIGREWRGSGVLTGVKGKIYGIPVADVRFPLSWVANFDREWGTLKITDVTGTAAKGRASGQAEVSFFADRPMKLAGEVKFTNLNAAQAFQGTAGNIAGNAPINGKFTFNSDQLRTANDLTGKLEATLGGDSQPFGLPVFSSFVPFLGFGRDAGTVVNAGEVKASLGNGVWRVSQLTLSGPALNVYAEGTVTTSGRINAFVAGSTGRTNFTPSVGGRIGTLASQLLTAPVNRNALNEAIGILGNFVIYLDVTGTVDAPNVKLQTVRTVSEGAVRFFLMQYSPR